MSIVWRDITVHEPRLQLDAACSTPPADTTRALARIGEIARKYSALVAGDVVTSQRRPAPPRVAYIGGRW